MLEKIKSVLGDLSEQVESKFKEANVELAIMNDGSVVPADKHDSLKKDLTEVNSKLTDANTQVTTLTDQIKELGNTDDIDQLKADIKKANEDAETYKVDAEKRILNIQKNAALQTALVAADADTNNIDLLISQFDMDKINLTDDGKIIGFDDIVKPIKEKRAALFIKTTRQGTKPGQSVGEGDASINPWKKETLNLTEQGRILKSDPERARELATAAGRKI